MKILLVMLLTSLMASSNAYAHKDRIIAIAQDGTMPDIPSTFGPARLTVTFAARMNESPIEAMVLELGGKRIAVPACVTGLIRSKTMGDVSAYASWYHNEARLPYYLGLEFAHPGSSPKEVSFPGFKLLFNLRTGKLIKMEEEVVGDEGRSIQSIPVDLATRCSPAVLILITDRGVGLTP